MKGIHFEHIQYGYGSRCLFADAALHLYENQLHFLVGESGIGKTTLLNILAKRIEVPTMTCSLKAWQDLDSDEWAYQMLGYQLIDHGFMQELTVEKNIAETKRAYCSLVNIEELIQLFQFAPLMKKYPTQLSGGQKRLLSIILALLKDLPILLLDEPTSSLDEETKTAFLNYLKKYARQGHIVLMATNDEDIFQNADCLLKIENMKINEKTDTENENLILSEHHHPFPYRLKTILSYSVWKKWISIFWIVCMGIFAGHVIYAASDECALIDSINQELGTAYENTAYVYYPISELDKYLDYDPGSLLLGEEVEEFLKQNAYVQNVYPHYGIPVGEYATGKLEDGSYVSDMYLSSEKLGDIDVSRDYSPFIEFYYPEQLEGDDIYISNFFLRQRNIDPEDVVGTDIQIDAAIPISYADSEIVHQFVDSEGAATYIAEPCIFYTYRKTPLKMHISGTQTYRSELYYRSHVPLIYAPYHYVDEWLDTKAIPPSAYAIILKDPADIEALRNQLYAFDSELHLRYPPQMNHEFIQYNLAWKADVLSHHVLLCSALFLILIIFLGLFETLNRNDYLFLRYSGMPRKMYICYRMIEALLILMLISILSLIYFLIFTWGQYAWMVWYVALGTWLALLLITLTIYSIFLHLFLKRRLR